MNKLLQSIKCMLGFHSYNDVFGAFEYKPSPKFDRSNGELVLSDLDILHRLSIFRRDMELCQSVEDQTIVYYRCTDWFQNQGYSERVVKQIKHIMNGM